MAPAPFRAEQMGSLLRPQDLLDARALVRDKGVSPEEAGLPEVEKKAIADVVKVQQELGIKAVTSGEFVRTRFWGLMWVSRFFPGYELCLGVPGIPGGPPA